MAQTQRSITRQYITYEVDDTDILNPERGFHKNTDIMQNPRLDWVRSQGYTLVRSYVQLDDFRDRPLTPEFLQRLRLGLASVRAAGLKVLPIFSYNFPTDEDIATDRFKNSPDAPLPLVLQHIQQLKPVLHENEDILAALELGFVGAWGEWHSSANKLDMPSKKAIIHKAILNALPKSRMMQLRYPADLMAIFPTPITARQAKSQSYQARTGWANMCFLSNESDSGTYLPLDTKAVKQAYLEKMTAYVVVGGETCQITPNENRTGSEVALTELARFHFSYLNFDFFAPAISKWQQDGCLEIIRKRLGYRLRLSAASLPRTGVAGERIAIGFNIVNDGWAAPFNPRKVELVLRSKTDGAIIHLPLPAQPKEWQPGSDGHSLNFRPQLPADLPAGEYELLLNLPDPLPSLYDHPAYSIRLANRDLWENSTGFNRLNASIQIQTRTIQSDDSSK